MDCSKIRKALCRHYRVVRAGNKIRKRILSEREKELIRIERLAEEMQAHPGARFFIHVADETDDYGEPLVSAIRIDKDDGASGGEEGEPPAGLA